MSPSAGLRGGKLPPADYQLVSRSGDAVML